MLLVLDGCQPNVSHARLIPRDTYIFKPIQILVALSTNFALEGLFLLHTERPRIGSAGLGVDNGECAITILVQLLCGMPVGFVIPW